MIIWMTGIFFLVFLFPVTFLMWLLVLPFDRKRAVIHHILTVQSRLLLMLIPGWKITIEGRDKAVRGQTYIMISNHQSIIDILVINCLGYRFKWISKIENMKIPFLGWYLRMAGYITVDRGNDESKAAMLARSYDCLKKGTSIMIFPEGTRSSGIEPGLFKRGAFQLALETGLPVLPIAIEGTGDILPKHGRIFKGRHRISIRVMDPVYPGSFGTKDPDVLASHFREMIASSLDIKTNPK